MKNSANPIVDNNTMTLLEYPINRWVNRSIFSGREISMTEGTSVLLEPTDWGHRHFSSLHWLYPGASMSIDSPQDWDLFEAAKSTLTLKSKNGGGHTG